MSASFDTNTRAVDGRLPDDNLSALEKERPDPRPQGRREVSFLPGRSREMDQGEEISLFVSSGLLMIINECRKRPTKIDNSSFYKNPCSSTIEYCKNHSTLRLSCSSEELERLRLTHLAFFYFVNHSQFAHLYVKRFLCEPQTSCRSLLSVDSPLCSLEFLSN